MLYYIFFKIDSNALICISWLPFYCILSILCKHSLHRHIFGCILHVARYFGKHLVCILSEPKSVWCSDWKKQEFCEWWTPWKLVTSRKHQRLSGILMKSLPHLSFSYCYFVSPRIKTQLVASIQFPILDFLSNHAADESSIGW